MRTRRIVLALGIMLAGCAMLYAAGGAETAGSASAAGTTAKFPDNFPAVPAPVDPKAYAYDDMSTTYDFEIMTYGYIVAPVADNPITKYMEKKLNAKITFTDVATADLNTQVTVRFAAGNPPDLIRLVDGGGVTAKNTALTLFEQGQTMAVDGVLQYLPQMTPYITSGYKNWVTSNKQMMAIPRYPTFQNNWGFFARTDWLKKLGMKMPTNESELFDYAKACVEKDPNGNGKADTWFMAAAGAGKSMGMLDGFRSMFGHPSWNVKDGKVNNPMLDGTSRDFVKFVKKLYDAKTLLPDWYTIEWEQFKSYSMNDQIGMVEYPGWNLVSEQWNAHKQDLSTIGVWEPTATLKSADGRGGKYRPGSAPEGLIVFPKGLDKNPGKMKRVMHFLDSMVYPNENYWAVSQGGDNNIYPGMSRMAFNKADGTNVFWLNTANHPAYKDPNLNPLWNWQTFTYTLMWQVYDDDMGKVGSKWNQYVNGLPRYTNYDILLTLDPVKDAKVKELTLRAEIDFVLGQRNLADWDKYVAEWKAAGGDELMTQAAQQLGVSK
jgi:putative aldouronate transport system substrate-binding protein